MHLAGMVQRAGSPQAVVSDAKPLAVKGLGQRAILNIEVCLRYGIGSL